MSLLIELINKFKIKNVTNSMQYINPIGNPILTNLFKKIGDLKQKKLSK